MSVSEVKRSVKSLLTLLEAGPVLLTHWRKPIGVAVTHEQWEKWKAEKVSLEQLIAELEQEFKKEKERAAD